MTIILSCDRCSSMDGLKMIQTRGNMEGNIYLCSKCRGGMVIDREVQELQSRRKWRENGPKNNDE